MKRVIITLGLLTAYAWVTAGVAPFSSLSYFLIATPCVAFVTAYVRMGGLSNNHVEVSEHFQRKAGGADLLTVAPWVALLTAAVILEVVGLLLGGRSTSVPTLSTSVDHLLADRWERCLLCLAWLLAGILPLRRLWNLFHVRDS
jgi:phosphate/sulfate permease